MCATTSPNDLGLTAKGDACACAAESTSVPDAVGAGPIREHYLVDGMTCAHCVSSVTEELAAIDGVDSVSVDLHAGGTSRVMVVSGRPIPVESVRAAVAEAGYALARS